MVYLEMKGALVRGCDVKTRCGCSEVGMSIFCPQLEAGVHWMVLVMKFERSESVKFCEFAIANQIYLGFIPKNKCPILEISQCEKLDLTLWRKRQ